MATQDDIAVPIPSPVGAARNASSPLSKENNMGKKPIDDSWIWKPGIDRLQDVYGTSDSDPPEDEEPSIWAELSAVSPLDPLYSVKIREIHEKNLRWVEAYAARLPAIRKQDVARALSDPRWLDPDRIQKRAENRERVSRQRARARAADPEGFRRAERDSRARRRKAQHLRRQTACAPMSVRKTAHQRS